MGFPTQDQICDAAERLNSSPGEGPVRTNGLWHALMFLRHRACLGGKDSYLFENSYGLAQAAFDVNGISLPIRTDSRNVYLEPGPTTMGQGPFRHRDGPRQTYLNRIYDGLTGVGPRQPKLFIASQAGLPTTISLAPGWLGVLRESGHNTRVLDTLLQEFLTWTFRFGIPTQDGAPAFYAKHLGTGEMELAKNVDLSPIPDALPEVKVQIQRYFGLSTDQFDILFPKLDQGRPSEWKATQAVDPRDLGPAILARLTRSSVPTAAGSTNAGQAEQSGDLVGAFVSDARAAGLRFQPPQVARFVASLLAKKFLILTGLSGSGKTKLAQSFAKWISPHDRCYELVPVGADWTSNESVLGYPDGLQPPLREGDTIVKQGVYVTKPALDLIHSASGNEHVPHFLILDEMNLSHVERYFADFLSLMESGSSTTLYCDARSPDGSIKVTRSVDPSLRIPANLFVIGTVNVDETTHMFSPKVLDRANVIEFRVNREEISEFLRSPNSPDLAKLVANEEGRVAFAKAARQSAVEVPEEVKDRFESEMMLYFALQREHGAEFGYRVAVEAARFIHFYRSMCQGLIWDEELADGLGDYANADSVGRDWFDAAFDAVVVQKFLPKLHGSKVKLGLLLRKLFTACSAPPTPGARDAHQLAGEWNNPKNSTQLVEPSARGALGGRYPLAADKVWRMWRQLNENGYASFPEN